MRRIKGSGIRRSRSRLARLGVFAGVAMGVFFCVMQGVGSIALGSTLVDQDTMAVSVSVSAPVILAASTTSTVATTSTTSTTVAPPLISEEELQTRASAWAGELKVDPSLTTCHLTIPEIGIDLSVLEMVRESLLDKGPGHWPETPLPGMGGHFVISGHRTLYGGPFLRVGELEAGDAIIVTLPYAEVRYEVTRTLIVGWTDMDVVQSRGLEELSLTTCNPIGRADNVMVVQAQAVDFRPTDQ